MENPYAKALVEELTFAEQFVLWAMRSWVAQLHAEQPDTARLREGFRVAEIPDGLVALDGLLGILGAAARRSLDMRCVTCRRIGDDEGLLLQVLAALQAGKTPAAFGVLLDWLPPAAARIAFARAIRFATVLRCGGFRLPAAGAERDWTRRAVPPHPGTGPQLLH